MIMCTALFPVATASAAPKATTGCATDAERPTYSNGEVSGWGSALCATGDFEYVVTLTRDNQVVDTRTARPTKPQVRTYFDVRFANKQGNQLWCVTTKITKPTNAKGNISTRNCEYEGW